MTDCSSRAAQRAAGRSGNTRVQKWTYHGYHIRVYVRMKQMCGCVLFKLLSRAKCCSTAALAPSAPLYSVLLPLPVSLFSVPSLISHTAGEPLVFVGPAVLQWRSNIWLCKLWMYCSDDILTARRLCYLCDDDACQSDLVLWQSLFAVGDALTPHSFSHRTPL